MKAKTFRMINAAVMLAIVLFVLAGWIFVDTDVYYKDVQGITEITPDKVESPESMVEEYTFYIDTSSETSYSFIFYTNHLETYVYADGDLIYSNEKVDTIYSHTTGSVWNSVEIPHEAKEILVRTEQIFPEVSSSDITFYYGDGVSMYKSMLASSVFEMVVCLFILGIGFCLLVYFYMIRVTKDNMRDILHLGLFSVIFGTWAMGETTGAMLLFANRPMASFTGFVCLLLVPIPFTYFIRYFMQAKDKLLHRVVLLTDIIFTIVLLGMQFLNIRDLKQNSLYCQMPIIIAFVYFFYVVFSSLKNKAVRRRFWLNIIGGILMVSSFMIDILAYYRDRVHADQFAKFGFLFYIIILGVETARGARIRLEENRKNDFYKQLAVKDMLTECYNRNAMERDIKTMENARGCHVVTFDLNNLKKCNDTLGHKEGDKYLMASAKLICAVFGRFGKIYRIGGDEFVAITRGIDTFKVEELVNRLREEQSNYYTSPEGYHLGIACGYAKYDPLEDKDLEDTRDKADEVMYQNKKRMKDEN